MKHDLGVHLLEVVTPRTNAALLSSAEHLFGALTLTPDAGPVALEIGADHERRRFLLRVSSASQRQRLAGQLGAAYPQAQLRLLDLESGVADPARLGDDEQLATCTLGLRAAPYLPLRIFGDRDLDADAGPAQADPVLGILGALADLPHGWRSLAQLVVLRAAPSDWAEPYRRLALESPVQAERSGDRGPSLVGPLLLLGLAGLALVGTSVAAAWQQGDWAGVLGPVGGLAALGGGILGVRRWLGHTALYEPRLVAEKLSCAACLAELRLAVIAPAFAPAETVHARLERLAAAYRPFTLAAGNELVPRGVRRQELDLRNLMPLASGGAALLNVRELAGLWHLPQAADEVAALERTTARRRLPLAATVAEGCRVGVAEHQGQRVPVHLAPALLRRHLLAVAKTRRGKSSLLLRLVQHHLARPDTDPHSLILVDPHRDLALAALGLVPPERASDVVYLDIANHRRPFGLNLLDVGLGWDRDQAVGNALRIFRREFDAFWGPRMEDAFRVALMALFEANQALCRDDPQRGRAAQHTVLEVPALLSRRGFRIQVLKQTSDPMIAHWFETYFEPLDPRLRLEIINPVQTKVHKYLASRAARQIVGQPVSTIDFRELIAEGRVVIVNLSLFEVGEDTAALVGGTLLNLAARAIGAQATLPPPERRPVTVMVDEFHTIPGADYEQVLGELAKYGANMVLATQTLARLDRLTDAQRTRDLRAAVFSNLDGLFAFHCSAEDAAYLAPELGGGLDEQDLLELGHYQLYARLTDMATGERLPAFSLRLDPPPPSDFARAEQLAEISARRYGRDAVDVDLDLQTALERMHGPRCGWPTTGAEMPDDTSTPATVSGVPAVDGIVAGTSVARDSTPRDRRARGPRTRRSRPGRDVAPTISAADAAPDQSEALSGGGGRLMRVGVRTEAALATLDRCPYLPADVLACLLGLPSRTAAHHLLARLARVGLAEARAVELGHVRGGRPIGLWSLTKTGRHCLYEQSSRWSGPATEVAAYGVPTRPRARPRPTDLPLLVSTYRLLAAFVVEQASSQPIRVVAWEYHWRRTCQRVRAMSRRSIAVELPGAADLAPVSRKPGYSVLLLPDLGTAPIGHYRALVRRLLELRADKSDPSMVEPVLLIATPDPYGSGGRAAAWRRLLDEVAAQRQEHPLRSRVLTWEQVAALAGSAPAAVRPATSTQQLLDLVGRHPCLSLAQLAKMLSTSRRRAARLRDALVVRGWLQAIPATDIPPSAVAQLHEEPQALGLSELTPLGRRVLAGWLGLNGPTAARYHGLSGGDEWAGRRRRLLRTLAHTLGTNDVFVAFALAARQEAARGQDAAFEEWRSASACEARLCKPDGYGRYRRGRATFCFFLEYDRATERAARYAAKFDAYYRYRGSRRAAHDYDGFPVVLVVTTDETAEHRIADAAVRAWMRHGGSPIAVRITRVDLIASQRDGPLGPIWHSPYEHIVGPRGRTGFRDKWI